MEQRLIRVLTALTCDPWLLPPQIHVKLTEIATNHARGGDFEERQHAVAAAMPMNGKKRAYQMAGNTAVIPVEGIIGRKFSDALYSSGVTSIDVLDRMLAEAATDDQIGSVLLVFDSPGGLAMGVPEVGQRIRQVGESKPVLAYADGLMGSAAYWLASQANAIYAMPSADVGSIGVYIAVLDQSRRAEMAGLEVNLFKSGKHKGMGYPGTRLSDEQKAMLQERVDTLAAQFKAAVREGRGKPIDDDCMQGQSFDAATAMKNGLVDSVCDLETALRDVGRLADMRKR